MSYLRMLQLARQNVLDQTDDGKGGGGAGGDNNPPEPKIPEPTFEMTDEIKTYLASTVEQTIAQVNAERDAKEKGLRDNKETILTELKDARQKVKDLEHTHRMKAGDVAGVTAEIEARVEAKYKDQISEKTTELANLRKTINNNSINSALDAHLEDLKVKSTLKAGFKAQLLTENKVELSKDTGKLLINDQPSEVHFNNWAATDAAKDFVIISPSSGGGGQGSGNPGGSGRTIADLSKTDGSSMFATAREIQNKK